MPWFEAVGFVVFGFIVGTYGSMLGVGGGFVIVPLLLFLGIPSRIAAGTSLAVVLVNSGSSLISYLRQKRVDVRSGLIFSAAGIPGALLGAYVDQFLPHRVFTILFGLLLIGVALRGFFTNTPATTAASAATATPAARVADTTTSPEDPQSDARASRGQHTRDFVDAMGVRHQYRYNVWAAVAVSATTGFLASLFGVGGGVVQVPAMVYLFSFPMHIAVATSQLIIFVTSVFGTGMHAYYGDVLILPALFLGIGAISGAQLGARLAARMHPTGLLRAFSVLVTLAALYLIYSALFKR